MRILVLSLALLFSTSSVFGFVVPPTPFALRTSSSKIYLSDDSAPSDYDSFDLQPDEKSVLVDTKEEDATIRDALKRELLLLASVTNRGECATKEEKNLVIDLVTQLEALNPTADPAHNSEGEWDLCLSSTQFFRSSPFFMAIRTALGDNNKSIAETGFDIHDKATTASRVGRVRQTIYDNKLVSEVDLEAGLLPGLPLVVKGTVITTAELKIISDDTWEVKVQNTKVRGSNIPIVNQILEDSSSFEIPVGSLYTTLRGSVPVSVLKTFYLDEGIRIVEDEDENFFVFAKA